MEEIQKTVQLEGDKAVAMRSVAEKWFEYYYRPLLFPDQYFSDFKPSAKYRLLRRQLPQLYDQFVKLFAGSCCNENTLNCFEELKLKMDKESADRYFVQVWYFVKYALSNNDAALQLRQATTIPLAGRLVVLLENASNKQMQEQFAKVEVFLHQLFLDTYPQWFKEARLE